MSDKVRSKYHPKDYTAFSNLILHKKHGQNTGKVSAITNWSTYDSLYEEVFKLQNK